MTLEEALRAYLSHLRGRQLADSHIDSVRARIGRFVAGREGEPVAAVTADDVHRHFVALRGRGLAAGTLAGYKSSHRAFWRWLKKRKLVKGNPAKALRRREHNYSFEPVNFRAADPADFQTVLDCLDRFVAHRHGHPRDARDAALVSLAIDSSARRGELYNLRRRDVERALARGERTQSGRLVYRATTMGKRGTAVVRFFDETAALLRRWLALLPGTAVHVWADAKTGERVHLDYMASSFKRVCQFAGVPVFRFQAVRKRDVTDMIAHSGDAKMGQLYAGHKDGRTTAVYYNDIQQGRVDAAAAELASQRRGVPGLADEFFRRIVK